MEGFSKNVILETFIKNCRENPHSGKIRQNYRALLHEDLSMYYCCRRHNIAIKHCSQRHISATMQKKRTLASRLLTATYVGQQYAMLLREFQQEHTTVDVLARNLKVWHPRCVRSIIQSCSVYISIYTYSHETQQLL